MKCFPCRSNLRTMIPSAYIIEQLDRSRSRGSITTPDHVRLVVDKVEKNRIEAVHISCLRYRNSPKKNDRQRMKSRTSAIRTTNGKDNKEL